jgi:UDP-glucose:(glucosyl)LPS alpha-1,2-glucosyltransferase
MKNNFDLIETNEVGKNARGGTEMYMEFVYDGTVPRELLEQVHITPSRFRKFEPEKIRIWFEHNLPNDPESSRLKDPKFRNDFHKIVFLSNWHYQQFQNHLGLPYDHKSTVIEGGFFPLVDYDIFTKPTDKINIAYFTTPHRGLEILVPVFLKLAAENPDIHLHVHSSFKMYGWDSRDEQFEPLYKICREHPQITYHGFTEHSKLQTMIKDYHIFAYPNIWPETMCRAVLEAMSAGLLCVHPNLAALPDTTGCLNFMYDGTTDPQLHANRFCGVLDYAIRAIRADSQSVKNSLLFNKMYVDRRYSIDLVHGKWTGLLQQLVNDYPTVESRKQASQTSVSFTYNTNQR